MMSNQKNRGKWFEKAIEQSNTIYKYKNMALVDKIATPVNFNTRTGKAFFSAKSTVDFIGCDSNGRMIAFDAKEVAQKNLPHGNIADHQLEYLRRAHKLGADAFILVLFRFTNECFKINISDFYLHKHTEKRKSIPYDWIKQNCTKVVSRNGIMFDYLGT